MMKRRIVLVLISCMLLSLMAPWAMAAETEAASDPNSCGEGLTWTLEGNTLTISGSGEMNGNAPWGEQGKKIENLVLTGGVTKIGEGNFAGYDRLERIDFGDSLVEIGKRAFYDCPDLTVIRMPASFRKFGEECFRGCDALQRVYCDGVMPRFDSSCLWTGNYISVFYPTNNPWQSEWYAPLVSSYGGNLGIMMGNYDPSVLSEIEAPAEEAETEAPETEPEETEAPTQAPTEPTAAPTVAPTEAPTVPQTEPAVVAVAAEAPAEETTAPVTELAAPETEATLPRELEDVAEEVESKSWIGLVMIAAVITFLLAGTMIFRSATRKGGRYR